MSVPREPSLFALLIGINKYVNFPDLTLGAAVPDAKAMKHYLQSKRGVHPHRIRTLFDEEATRAAIITELQLLSDESNGIGRGDPIVIYYAGHGAEAYAPTGWETGGQKIQMLCPSDFEPKSESDDQTNHIYPIPDRTLGILIERIAAAKGDNITVIFDCCHSGSLTRDPEDNPEYIVRGVGRLDEVLPPDLDEAIWNQPPVGRSGQGSTTSSKLVTTGLYSHVLLAACGAQERARESRHSKRGLFTEVLLKALSSEGGDTLSYSQLIKQLPYWASQTPQCEGHQRHRRCFDSKAPVRIVPYYSIQDKLQSTSSNGLSMYLMKAGAADGITVGSAFAIYQGGQSAPQPSSASSSAVSSPQHPSESEPRAVVTAVEVLPYYTNVTVSSGTLPDGLASIKAKQIKAGTQPDLQIYFPQPVPEDSPLKHLSDAFEAIVKQEVGKLSTELPIKIARVEKADAELAIDASNGDIIVEALDSLATSRGLRRLLSFRQASAANFLRGAARYYRYLHQFQGENPFPDQIDVEIYKLAKTRGIRMPMGGNLIKEGVLDLVLGDGPYGIRIINRSKRDLYPNVFCFNSLELSIDALYECSVAQGDRVDCPLPANANLPIGFGFGGSPPVEFYPVNGHNLDVSTIKIFLSNQPVDMSHIAQRSHLEYRNKEGDELGRGGRKQKKEEPVAWGTISVTVIQRRYAVTDD